jgi:gas vesicle protein
MTFKDLQNVDKDDILAMLGLETKRSTGAWVVGTLGTFGVGLLVGAGIGLLLAPKPGRELRDDLRDKLRRTGENAADTMASMGGRDPLSSKTY